MNYISPKWWTSRLYCDFSQNANKLEIQLMKKINLRASFDNNNNPFMLHIPKETKLGLADLSNNFKVIMLSLSGKFCIVETFAKKILVCQNKQTKSRGLRHPKRRKQEYCMNITLSLSGTKLKEIDFADSQFGVFKTSFTKCFDDLQSLWDKNIIEALK